jgi:hypothetical protein
MTGLPSNHSCSSPHTRTQAHTGAHRRTALAGTHPVPQRQPLARHRLHLPLQARRGEPEGLVDNVPVLAQLGSGAGLLQLQGGGRAAVVSAGCEPGASVRDVSQGLQCAWLQVRCSGCVQAGQGVGGGVAGGGQQSVWAGCEAGLAWCTCHGRVRRQPCQAQRSAAAAAAAAHVWCDVKTNPASHTASPVRCQRHHQRQQHPHPHLP